MVARYFVPIKGIKVFKVIKVIKAIKNTGTCQGHQGQAIMPNSHPDRKNGGNLRFSYLPYIEF
ncbi:hypothetical protein ACFB49_25510 [Sphingomonas sp. DBB INV C78]